MWWLAGCAARALPAWAPPPEGATWHLLGLTAVDDATIEEQRTLRATRYDDGTLLVTARTALVVDGPDGHQSFDSDAPRPGDPWPLALQHTVAAAPARVRDEAGVLSLTDPEAWRDAATDALLRSSLPPRAVSTGMPLVDPAGFEAELRRWFPGMPVDGVLARPERFAGVDAERREVCVERPREAGIRRWRCEGTATDPGGRLRELATWTELSADRGGLRSVEQGYAGLLASGPDAARTLVPIAGRRLAERSVEAP